MIKETPRILALQNVWTYWFLHNSNWTNVSSDLKWFSLKLLCKECLEQKFILTLIGSVELILIGYLELILIGYLELILIGSN